MDCEQRRLADDGAVDGLGHRQVRAIDLLVLSPVLASVFF